MMDTSRLHAIVLGRVQGVNFRYYTTHEAQRLQLTGWVRNNNDGTVEVMAEGAPERLKEMLAFLKVGSPAAEVKEVKEDWQAATGEFKDFRTRYA
jgi:acylphosphatase